MILGEKYEGLYWQFTEEYKIICFDKNINKLYLENGNKVDNIYNTTDSPILVNDVGKLYDEFINKFSSVDKEILLKISEIEYIKE